MTAVELLTTLRQHGFTLTPLPGDKLSIKPAGKLTDELREQLRQCKAELLDYLTRPSINAKGELIIPCDCPPKYRYWAGGQSLAQTLRELNASPEVWARYTEAPYQQVH